MTQQEFDGLVGEVVTEDIYRLNRLQFVPDLVFDIGANVGVFTRFARRLWPAAQIVAVEPDTANLMDFARLGPRAVDDPNFALVPHALGRGPIFKGAGARNGSGQTYLSCGLGYAPGSFTDDEQTNMIGLSLPDIMRPHWNESKRTVMKIDCEGAENCLWQDEESMRWLRRADYICMEVHFYAADAEQHETMKRETMEALKSLEATHDCELDNVNFWGTKRA